MHKSIQTVTLAIGHIDSTSGFRAMFQYFIENTFVTNAAAQNDNKMAVPTINDDLYNG